MRCGFHETPGASTYANQIGYIWFGLVFSQKEDMQWVFWVIYWINKNVCMVTVTCENKQKKNIVFNVYLYFFNKLFYFSNE